MPITHFPTEQKEIVMLYDDTVRLEFSPSGHRYKVFHKGVEIFGTKGATTIIGIVDKPELLSWAARMTNEAWIEGLKAGKPDELTIAKLAKEAPLAWRVKRDTAGDLGTIVHRVIEQWILADIKRQKYYENK